MTGNYAADWNLQQAAVDYKLAWDAYHNPDNRRPDGTHSDSTVVALSRAEQHLHQSALRYGRLARHGGSA